MVVCPLCMYANYVGQGGGGLNLQPLLARSLWFGSCPWNLCCMCSSPVLCYVLGLWVVLGGC